MELLSVYVPTNHIYIGDIFLLQRADVIRTSLSVREGLGAAPPHGRPDPLCELVTLQVGRHGCRVFTCGVCWKVQVAVPQCELCADAWKKVSTVSMRKRPC